MPCTSQHAHGTYLRTRGAHYIAQVKANHPGLFDRVRRLPWREITLDHQDRTRAHHRLEIRRLKTVAFAHLDYPDARKQSAVLDDATRLAPQIIAGRLKGAVVEGLETAAVAAFGESEARAILMVLGPADTQGAAPRSDRSIQAVDCNSQCAGTGSCSSVCYASCNWSDYGCGPLWLGPCSGFCS
jgi:hypothetical protein